MAVAIPSRDVASARQPRITKKQSYSLQASLLFVALVALAVVMHLSASPAGFALHPSTAQSAVDLSHTEVLVEPANRPPEHFVLIVDDIELGRVLRDRIEAEQTVYAERGAAATPVVFELIEIGPDDDVSTLLLGLTEYELHCSIDPCPAIRLIDLRSARPAEPRSQ